ncbi:MAG TPA: MFS transporter [Methylovirgula sp.]
MSILGKATFRSLKGFNYRLFAGGALVSNIGTWLQRTAQDWIVLTQLTRNNATAVGIVMALQFGPMLLLLPWTGLAADRFDRRKLIIVTQAAQGLLALVLGILTITGLVQLWHVYVFAFLLGCVAAFDTPARQAFVSELVGEDDLANAVALNSTSFNAARLVGPALAGLMIAAVGSGWVFVVNAISFVAVVASLAFLRVHELHREARTPAQRGGLTEGFQYVLARPQLVVMFVMFFLIGTFGINFPIFIPTMSVTVFHLGAGEYGVLTSMVAIGTLGGALIAAREGKPGVGLLSLATACFGLGCCVAAAMPNYWLFGLVLVFVGASGQVFGTTTLSLVQLSTEPNMRGRVMAILLAIALGGTPLGGPIVGWVVDRFGPRAGLAVGGASAILAALVGLYYLARWQHWRLRVTAGRLHFARDGEPSTAAAE